MTAVAEFIGGGIRPWARIESVRLFSKVEGWGFIVLMSELLFALSTFYYVVNVVAKMKKGIYQFFKVSWNLADLTTAVMSVMALILYAVRSLVVNDQIMSLTLDKQCLAF